MKAASSEIRRSPWRLLYKPGPGEIVPAPASPKRASWLRKQATALLALRDALLDAEKDAAETEFHALRKAGR